MNNSSESDILELLSGEKPTPRYHDKKPSPDATFEFDEPEAPEGSCTLPPQHLRGILSRLKRKELDLSTPPEPLYMLNGQCWATEGNFSVFSALSKAGKSAVSGSIVVSTLPGEGDTMGFTSSNIGGKALVCIDTEQSDYHHDKKMAIAMKRKGYGPWGTRAIPDWVAPYALAGEVLDVTWLEAIMWSEFHRCGGIHSVILDGVADLVRNVNDPAEADKMSAELMRLAKLYKCHIIAIIHINPGSADSGKTRGHLGSTLERKAETNLTIKVTDRDRVVYARNARDCDIPEKKGTRFAWNDDAGMFVTTEAGAPADGFGVPDVLEYLYGAEKHTVGKSCLKKAFVGQYGVSDRTVERHISSAKDAKFLEESGPKNDKSLKLTAAGIQELRRGGILDNPPEEK